MSDQSSMSPAAIRALLCDFLHGRDDWMAFIRRVTGLWQDLVSTDTQECEWRNDTAVAGSESGEPARAWRGASWAGLRTDGPRNPCGDGRRCPVVFGIVLRGGGNR